MPHITSLTEKMGCVKMSGITYSTSSTVYPTKNYKLMDVANYTFITKGMSAKDRQRWFRRKQQSIFDMIEDIINNTLTNDWIKNPFLEDFVNIKEVPYGRYNPDSDYRGS